MKLLMIIQNITLILAIGLAACSKKGNSSTAPLPSAAINDLAQQRASVNSVYRFTVSLDQRASANVTIHYSTLAGTAAINTDFIPASGTLTIPSGSQQGIVEVTITADSLRKEDQLFYVQLDDPKNCSIQDNKGTGTIINKNGFYFPVNNAGYTSPTTYPGYTLTWSDEFTGKTINAGSWSFESGNNNGWGNNELENYTSRSENAFVSEGNLIIEARAEPYAGNAYTSARMISKNKKVFKYGRIDIRAKMPTGKGVWPALWMLGNNIDQVNWPACGEIDILELLGHETSKIYGTMHWGATSATHAMKGDSYVSTTGGFDQQFHVYSLVWKENDIKVLIDDHQFVSVTSADVTGPYPFNNDFFLLFNVAVGGNWPGAPDNTTVFPQRMIVDYVRVFQ